jgi:hypothetical protein
MLAPKAMLRGITLDGPRYLRPSAWGHLLNEHYLRPIEEKQKSGRRRGGKGGPAPFELINAAEFPGDCVPRLYAYLNGGSPD